MSNLKIFLKVLEKYGYPNPKIETIAETISYNLNDFLVDLIEDIGHDATVSFVDKALSKLSEGDKGIKIDLEYGGYVYITPIIEDIDRFGSVNLKWNYTDTSILAADEDGNEVYKTLDEIYDEIDLGGLSDFDELIEYIQKDADEFIFDNCGFYVSFT
jgi:hypothetical protein